MKLCLPLVNLNCFSRNGKLRDRHTQSRKKYAFFEMLNAVPYKYIGKHKLLSDQKNLILYFDTIFREFLDLR